jgi:anthranilate phosphoribosyltransferase
LIVESKARDFQDGIEMAKEAIESGKAKKHLKKIVEVSQKLG